MFLAQRKLPSMESRLRAHADWQWLPSKVFHSRFTSETLSLEIAVNKPGSYCNATKRSIAELQPTSSTFTEQSAIYFYIWRDSHQVILHFLCGDVSGDVQRRVCAVIRGVDRRWRKGGPLSIWSPYEAKRKTRGAADIRHSSRAFVS